MTNLHFDRNRGPGFRLAAFGSVSVLSVTNKSVAYLEDIAKKSFAGIGLARDLKNSHQRRSLELPFTFTSIFIPVPRPPPHLGALAAASHFPWFCDSRPPLRLRLPCGTRQQLHHLTSLLHGCSSSSRRCANQTCVRQCVPRECVCVLFECFSLLPSDGCRGFCCQRGGILRTPPPSPLRPTSLPSTLCFKNTNTFENGSDYLHIIKVFHSICLLYGRIGSWIGARCCYRLVSGSRRREI
jgi:hypothetical protein